MSRRQLTQRRLHTRDRLLDAARDVFAESGIDAPVEEICERAGYSRGAFYSNFSSKEQLFIELALQMSERKLEAIGTRLDELKTRGLPSMTTDTIVAGLLEALVDERTDVLLMSEVRTNAMRIPDIAAAYLAWSEQMLAAVTQIITEVLHETELQGRLPAADIAWHLVTTWESTSQRAAIEGLEPDAMRSLVTRQVSAIARVLVESTRLEK